MKRSLPHDLVGGYLFMDMAGAHHKVETVCCLTHLLKSFGGIITQKNIGQKKQRTFWIKLCHIPDYLSRICGSAANIAYSLSVRMGLFPCFYFIYIGMSGQRTKGF